MSNHRSFNNGIDTAHAQVHFARTHRNAAGDPSVSLSAPRLLLVCDTAHSWSGRIYQEIGGLAAPNPLLGVTQCAFNHASPKIWSMFTLAKSRPSRSKSAKRNRFDRRAGLEALERRNLLTALVWSSAPDLPEPRTDAAAVIAPNDAVYLFGGDAVSVTSALPIAMQWSRPCRRHSNDQCQCSQRCAVRTL